MNNIQRKYSLDMKEKLRLWKHTEAEGICHQKIFIVENNQGVIPPETKDKSLENYK